MAILFRYVLIISCLVFFAGQSGAVASTMPAADRLRHGLRLSSGPALGLSWHSTPRTQMGVSCAAPFFHGTELNTLRYSAYGMYKLFDKNGFYMAGVGGVYGDVFLPDVSQAGWVGLQAGAAFAYDLHPQWTLRLNITPGVLLYIPPVNESLGSEDAALAERDLIGWSQFPPLMGVELAWRPSPNLEASLGFNGNGDILSVSWLWGA